MKKIFLLSLLSVLFLSAFSQILSSSPEVLAHISISRSADVTLTSTDDFSTEIGHDEFAQEGWWPRWWFLYKYVYTEVYPWGVIVRCEGKGWRICWARPNFVNTIFNLYVRGIDSERMEATYQCMIEESEEQAASGEYQGSITKKLAFPDPDRGGKESYLLYQMNWDYDSKNPRNGKAEITISKTNSLGF